MLMGSMGWRWISRGLLPLALAVQRACWLWLWLDLLRRWVAPWRQADLLPAFALVGLSLGAMVVAEWALAGTASLRRARLRVAGAGIAIVLVVVWWRFFSEPHFLWQLGWLQELGQTLIHPNRSTPLVVVTMLITAYLWLRGLVDGRGVLIHDQVWGAFTAGFMNLVLYVVVASLDPQGLPAGTDRVIILFFLAGMLALALSSLEMARGSGWRRVPTRFIIGRHAFFTILISVVVLTAIGLGLSAIFAPEDVTRMVNWVGSVMSAISAIIFTVILVLSYLLYLVIYPLIRLLIPLIEWLIALFGIGLRLNPAEDPEPPESLEDLAGLAVNVPDPVRWALLAGVFLLVGLVFALALRRLRLEPVDAVEETRETILTRDLLRDQWAELWRKWLQRLRRAGTAVWSPFLSLEGEAESRRIIRSVYQALLTATQARGYPRPRGQTPLEYRRGLERILPNPQNALDTITEQYVRARYGAAPPTMEQAAQAQAAWQQIEEQLQATSELSE